MEDGSWNGGCDNYVLSRTFKAPNIVNHFQFVAHFKSIRNLSLTIQVLSSQSIKNPFQIQLIKGKLKLPKIELI